MSEETMMRRKDMVLRVCRDIAEMAVNCNHDLTGDHRKNYNPRIDSAGMALSELFPVEMFDAMKQAKLFGNTAR